MTCDLKAMQHWIVLHANLGDMVRLIDKFKCMTMNRFDMVMDQFGMAMDWASHGDG